MPMRFASPLKAARQSTECWVISDAAKSVEANNEYEAEESNQGCGSEVEDLSTDARTSPGSAVGRERISPVRKDEAVERNSTGYPRTCREQVRGVRRGQSTVVLSRRIDRKSDLRARKG